MVSVLLSNFAAFIKGAGIRFFAVIFSCGGIRIGKAMRICHGAAIHCRKGATVSIGHKVKVDEDATLSALNGGTLKLGNNVGIGCRNMIICHERIEIDDNTILAPNVLVYDHDHVFDNKTGVIPKEYRTTPVIIGKNCWIGANTVILRGTTIGDNCVIGAGCVIKGCYEAGSVIVQKRETMII